MLGSLPYQVLATGDKFNEVPSSFRNSLTVTLDAGKPGPISYTTSLAKLGLRRLGLTYIPATEADAQLLQSYKTQGITTLQPYLLKVIPTLQIDGVTITSGEPIAMGETQYLDTSLYEPSDPNAYAHTSAINAGDEIVIGVNGNGIAEAAVRKRFADVPSDTAAENLFQVSLNYWMVLDVLDGLAGKSNGVTVQRLGSIGIFASPLNVFYWFGIPTRGYYKQRTMDITHSLMAAAASKYEDVVKFQTTAGMLSSHLEGAIFEQLFGLEAGRSISTVRLLIDANEQSIPIHTITSANLNVVLPKLALGAPIKDKITNAVNAGKKVIVPERAPVHGNWKGIGYIIQDTETGGGAYLISSGLNGGENNDPCSNVSTEPAASKVRSIFFYIIMLIAAIGVLIVLIPVIIDSAGAIVVAIMAGVPVLSYAASPSANPARTCTDAIYTALRIAVGTACSGSGKQSCNESMTNCDELRSMKNKALACIQARQNENNECWGGADPVHQNEIDNRLKGVNNCNCIMAARGCPP